MNAKQAEKAQANRLKEREHWFMEGVKATQENMIKSLYSAAALAAYRKFNFTDDQCIELLTEMDNIVCNYFTTMDMVDQAFVEIGIKMDFHDGIEPVKKIEEEEEKLQWVQ